jgi:hypothetical protein
LRFPASISHQIPSGRTPARQHSLHRPIRMMFLLVPQP